MKLLDEPLLKACQKIIEFKRSYGIRWEDFRELGRHADKYYGLDARRWVLVVRGKVRPHDEKRQLTLELAELIDTSPDTILQYVPPRRRNPSAPLLPQPGFRETRNVSDSEALAKEMIARADNGLPKESVETLLGACKLLLPYHPDEAMAPLRALVYLSSRYLKPVQFISSVMRILPMLEECTRIHSVDQVLRGQVIAQVAGYLLDRGNIDAGEFLLHHDYIKMMSESSWVAEPLQLQMRRTQAVVEAHTRNRFDEAIDRIKEATVSGDAGSVRGSAIATSTVWRMQRRFDKAYSSIMNEYESCLDILSEAASNKRLNTGSLLHQFCCVLRGSIARYVDEVEKGRKEVDLTKEIDAMNWVLECITPPALETNDLHPLPDKIRLPPDLEEIRNRCRVPILSDSDVNCLCQLVQALEQ